MKASKVYISPNITPNQLSLKAKAEKLSKELRIPVKIRASWKTFKMNIFKGKVDRREFWKELSQDSIKEHFEHKNANLMEID